MRFHDNMAQAQQMGLVKFYLHYFPKRKSRMLPKLVRISCSDWRKDLSRAQIEYAVQDVVFVEDLMEKLYKGAIDATFFQTRFKKPAKKKPPRPNPNRKKKKKKRSPSKQAKDVDKSEKA